MKRRSNNVFNRLVGGGLLLFLSSFSALGVGFSSWATGAQENPSIDINAQIGDVIVGKSLLNDYKFTAEYNSSISQSINTYTRNNVENNTYTYNPFLSVNLNANIKSTELFFNQEYDLSFYNTLIIKFILKNSLGNVINKSSSFIDKCWANSKRFDNNKFLVSEYSETIDTFYMPFKSKLTLSLFQLSLYDKSYSPYSDSLYVSPITFTFSFNESKIKNSIDSNNLFCVEFSII